MDGYSLPVVAYLEPCQAIPTEAFKPPTQLTKTKQDDQPLSRKLTRHQLMSFLLTKFT